MPRTVYPTKDRDRLSFLQASIVAATDDKANNRPTIDEVTQGKIQTLLPQFQTAIETSEAAKSQRAEEVEESVQAREMLKRYIRDMQEVIRRRVWRQKESAAVFNYYGMTLAGRREYLATVDEWIALAEQIIAGDAEAVKAGYETAVCPSIDELKAVLATARKEHDEVAPADSAYQEAQQQVAEYRAETNALIQEIAEQIRFYYRNESDEGIRRILRRYGVRYTYRSGEPVDDGDTNPVTE